MNDERILTNASGETNRINLASAGRYVVALDGRILEAPTVAELHKKAEPLGWTPAKVDNSRLFTPRHAATDERLELRFGEYDDMPPSRGKWAAIVSDRNGERWLAYLVR